MWPPKRQAGRTRRGANMGVLRVDHPDIEAFINAKTTPNRLTNFNLSVALTDNFLQALEKGTDYDLINPRNGQKAASMPARKIFDLMVQSAWQAESPELFSLTASTRIRPPPISAPSMRPIPAENSRCCLTSHARWDPSTFFGWCQPRNCLQTPQANRSGCCHFLDNVIEVNRYPLPQIEKMSRKTRKSALA